MTAPKKPLAPGDRVRVWANGETYTVDIGVGTVRRLVKRPRKRLWILNEKRETSRSFPLILDARPGPSVIEYYDEFVEARKERK